MAIPRQPDEYQRLFVRTFNDPRIAANGRPAKEGEFLIWVDETTGRAHVMLKVGPLDTDYEPLSTLELPTSDIANDAVTTAKILDLNVTAAKLAAAVATKIFGTPTVTPQATGASPRTCTIQLKDIAGTNLAAIAHARVWLSDTAGGAPTASAPDGGVAVSAGVQIAAITAGKVLDVLSTAAGVITLTLTHAGADTTWYVNVAVGDIVASAAVVIDNP